MPFFHISIFLCQIRFKRSAQNSEQHLSDPWHSLLEHIIFRKYRQSTAEHSISLAVLFLWTQQSLRSLSCAGFHLSGHEDKDLECCNQIRNCSVTPWHRHLDTWIAPTRSQQQCNGQRTNLLCSGWSRVLWCIINERTEWNVGEQVCYLIFHCARSKINGRLHWCSAVRLQGTEGPLCHRHSILSNT